MLKKLKLRAIGNSTGVVLPKEILDKLRVSRGDELMVLETPDGIRLTGYDPEFERQMDVAEKIMHRRRNMLRKLAE
jgi:putative addiction module antidote